MRAALVVVLLLLPSAAAGWNQPGGDRGGSGFIDGPGLDWPDIAHQLRAPAISETGIAPIWHGQEIYWTTNDVGSPFNGGTVHRFNVTTAHQDEVFSFPGFPFNLAYGDGLVVLTANTVFLWRDGTLLSQELESLDQSEVGATTAGCKGLSVDHEIVVACGGGLARVYVLDWDLTILREKVIDDMHLADSPDAEIAARAIGGPNPLRTEFAHVAVNDDLIVVSQEDPTVCGGLQPCSSLGAEVWFLDRETLEVLRSVGRSPFEVAGAATLMTVGGEGELAAMPAAIIGDEFVFVEDVSLHTFDAVTAEPGPVLSFRRSPFDGELGGEGAVSPNHIIATGATSVHAWDRFMATLWEWDFPNGGKIGTAHPLLFRDVLVLDGGGGEGEQGMYAIDLVDGSTRWQLPGHGGYSSAANGLIATQSFGAVTIYGRSPHSPTLLADVTSNYPGVGEDAFVQVVAEGGLGNVTGYRISWGDGVQTGWTDDGEFSHRYSTARDFTARIHVRNDAGQTASLPIVFHVGQRDPAISFFNSPFDAEYQETTFFVLGLLATAALAALGIYRSGTKRRRFHRELEALEDEYRESADEPARCDAMLAERRTTARALFLEKRIEEAHASFLERRVEEMRRSLRLGTVEDQLKFLPYGMVSQLQRLLADGHVDEWERTHFVEALEAQKGLTAKQKAQARRVVDEWFARDMV